MAVADAAPMPHTAAALLLQLRSAGPCGVAPLCVAPPACRPALGSSSSSAFSRPVPSAAPRSSGARPGLGCRGGVRRPQRRRQQRAAAARAPGVHTPRLPEPCCTLQRQGSAESGQTALPALQ